MTIPLALPPAHLTTAALFRRVVRRDHQAVVTLPKSRRPIVVRSLTPLEEGTIHDEATLKPEPVRADWLRCAFVAAAVRDPQGRRLWADGDAMAAALPEDLADAVAGKVMAVALSLGPSRLFSDYAAWDRAIRDGANHDSNAAFAVPLGQCVGANGAPRPDRYWGLSLCQITEGQWIAFRAARAMVLALMSTN